ncbi:MAG: glycosyltransferase family 4 protein [Ignavibacteria bacterium]|nr:glycosyltransferase family 4 protein [Ignavibacteria bacterium]
MKSILMITHSSNLTGGGEDDFYRLLKYFKKKYHIISVIPEGPRAAETALISDEFTVIPNGIFPFTGFGIKSYAKYIIGVYSKTKVLLPFLLKHREKIDICFVNSSTCIIEMFLLYILGIPYILSIKEITEPSFVRYLFSKFFKLTSKRVIVISNLLKEMYEKINGENSAELIYSSIEEELYEPVKREIRKNFNGEQDIFRIINIGVICPMKNQELLVRAMAKTAQTKKIEVMFIGKIIDEKYYGRINSLIGDLNLNNVTFCFPGEMKKENVIKALSMSDCVVITSLKEGMSLVLVESLFMEKPLLTTNVGVVPEIIEHGINGFIIDKDNPEILAEYINDLISDKNISDNISAMTYKYYSGMFSMERYLAGHDEVIIKAISK